MFFKIYASLRAVDSHYMSINLTRFYYEDLTDEPPRLDQVFEDIDTDEADAHEAMLINQKIDYVRVQL